MILVSASKRQRGGVACFRGPADKQTCDSHSVVRFQGVESVEAELATNQRRSEEAESKIEPFKRAKAIAAKAHKVLDDALRSDTAALLLSSA